MAYGPNHAQVWLSLPNIPVGCAPGLSPRLQPSPCWTPWWVGTSGDENPTIPMDSSQTFSNKPNKRQRLGLTSSDDEDFAASSFTRFLVIEPAKAEYTIPTHPIAVSKSIAIFVSKPKEVKRMRSGAILVEVQTKKESENLCKMEKILDTPVRVSPHRTLNQSKGIIRSSDLDEVSEEDLLSEIKDQGVTAVKRIPFTKNGVKLLSHTWEITFACPKVPNKLKVGFLALSVAPYIPNPMRCFKCQLFGHHQGYCKRDAVCSKCGKQGHDDKSCTQDPCCVNCKGSHPAYSKDCPKWKEEKEICRTKVMSNISFKEARRIVLEQKNTPVEGKSYANATSPQQNHCCTCTCKSSQAKVSNSNQNTSSAPSGTKSNDIKIAEIVEKQLKNIKSSSQQQSSNVSKQSVKNTSTSKSQTEKTTGAKGPKTAKPGTLPKEKSAQTPKDKNSSSTKNRFASLEDTTHMEINVPYESDSSISDS